MNYKDYIGTFQKAAGKLDKNVLQKRQVEVAVGEVLNSVFLKLYKKSWTNPFQDPLTADTRIFFSIWLNDAAINNQKIFYNIHALKLRHLKGYSIQSRKFANTFRESFKNYAHEWQNISMNFESLTLMEGWHKIDLENFQSDIVNLSNSF
jgi:hypothetical protein